MDLGYRLHETNLFRLIQTMFLLGAAFLFVAALKEYKGESYIYVLFTVASYALLYFGFRKNAIFFDTFIGIFFWLGFWLKLTVHVAFMGGQFRVAVGNFNGSGVAFDQALLITLCAFFGLLMASYTREKFLFVYPPKINETTQQGLFTFYKKYRKSILLGFVILFVTVAVTNVYFGIYQRGTITKTFLPYGLNGIYKWLLLFGLASFSAILLKFEYAGAKKTSYLIAILSLMESFVSNVSLLSRGMVLNTSALVYGVVRGIRLYEIKSSFRFLVTCFVIFVVLFGSSVFVVNYIRSSDIRSSATIDNNVQRSLADNNEELLNMTHDSTKVLFLDRWVGIEGVMAVSSYPEQGWDLWREAWQEIYSENRTSFYDINLIDSPYKNIDTTKHHFISLPGVIAFCFYPGSYPFLFFCMFIISMATSLIEIFAFKLGGSNVVLCALLAQVVAYRFASFGYVPAQSYLLFGTVFLNIIIIYVADKFLVYWFKL